MTDACTLCGDCAEVCPAERADEFNLRLSKTKAAYLPHKMAFPAEYVIDRNACKEGCNACVDACPYGAIDLDQQVERKKFHVAGGCGGDRLGALRRLQNHQSRIRPISQRGDQRHAGADGRPERPHRGKILRPSDGKEPATVAFVQCAGSRDENHLPYCSSVVLFGLAETQHLYPQSLSRGADHHFLH